MRVTRQLIGLGLALGLAAHPATGGDLRDLYFGEAFYHAYQGQYFDALQRLDTELAQYHVLDEPKLDTLHYHINNAEFSVGDFELDYRMHQRAGRAIKAVLEGAVDEAVRNEAAFRLARRMADHGKRSSNWTRPDRWRPVIPPLSRSATSRTWCWAPCCSNLAILSGPGRHWTASISRDRSRTRLCCGQAGLRPRPSSMTARSCRGTSWWIVSRRMPQFRK